MTKEKFIEFMKDYAIITFGVILIAFGIEYFYAPNSLAAGGLSGLSLIIYHFIPQISMWAIQALGNLILFIVAFILVGSDFGSKTIYATALLTGIMAFMEKIIGVYAFTNNLILAVIFGTLMVSFGLAIVFHRNASTGGTDILAKILNKYTNFNIGISLLCVDFCVTIASALTFGLDKGIYAFIAVIANGILVDKFVLLLNKRKESIIEETIEIA
ncbi:YitT family protein [Clostridium tarantellae]|uniref:YitT family protein n=1 Tax=Clostridium tarantellae TaxID=39493 RepID=A0A6I1MPU1_9CLOT|nr:YitT family protein [Clostridium tarantellae]MPQ44920.1 YitT family protein [Clostridium tarantellae]